MMSNNESPATARPTIDYFDRDIFSIDEVDMSDVMKTLRILSHCSMSNTIRHTTTVQAQEQQKCPDCNSIVSIQRGVRSKEDILRNLKNLERSMESRGEKLPHWVQAYQLGDSIKAAKLLHLSYLASKRPVRNVAKTIIQEATSTTTSPAEEGDEKKRKL